MRKEEDGGGWRRMEEDGKGDGGFSPDHI
jgi:hypothetical protein